MKQVCLTHNLPIFLTALSYNIVLIIWFKNKDSFTVVALFIGYFLE